MNEQALEAAAKAIEEFRAAMGYDSRRMARAAIAAYHEVARLTAVVAGLRHDLAGAVNENVLRGSAVSAYHDKVLSLEKEMRGHMKDCLEYCAANADLRAKLADCQAFIRERGHTEMCPATACKHCFYRSSLGGHRHSDHKFEACERCTCGHDRTTGEKS